MKIVFNQSNLLEKIKQHLFPRNNSVEQALFLLASCQEGSLKVTDSLFLNKYDFEIQSRWHIELKDQVWGQVIKQAHDLNTSIIEVHSHVDQKSAEFSDSDWSGFKEFVPHILWRLKNRPHGALVFTKNNFDGLIWHEKHRPEKLLSLESGAVQLV